MFATKELTKNGSANEKYIVPEVDTYETDGEYVLKADMPGVHKENLHITVEENNLTIEGLIDKKEERYIYSDFKPNSYKRVFKLGTDINPEGIKAQIENGVLTLTLSKVEKVKPRKIEITSE